MTAFFTYFNKTTGAITGQVEVPDEFASLQNNNWTTDGIYQSSVKLNPDDYYFVQFQHSHIPLLRTVMENYPFNKTSVIPDGNDKASAFSLANPTYITISAHDPNKTPGVETQTGTVTDGTLELTFTVPGVYDVKFEGPTIKPTTFSIGANMMLINPAELIITPSNNIVLFNE